MSTLGFYTYEHTRNDTGAVFYVGNMARWHFKNCKQKEL